MVLDVSFFRGFFYLMCVEAVLYGLYLQHCLFKGHTSHMLFRASEVCFWIILLEIVRCYLILRGVFHPTTKHFWVYMVELLPFGVVGYEILRKVLLYLYQKVWARREPL